MPSEVGAAEPCWRRQGDTLHLFVRVTPKSAADAIGAPKAMEGGRRVLPVRVRAVPESGRANAAVVQVVASALGLPSREVRLLAGHGAREKTLALPLAAAEPLRELVANGPASGA